jgi:ribosome modulation factor
MGRADAYMAGLRNAERAGFAAGHGGKPMHPCPYKRSDMVMSWEYGWRRAVEQAALKKKQTR